MKNKILGLAVAFFALSVASVHAVEIRQDGTKVGQVSIFNFTNGATVTKSGNVGLIDQSVSTSGTDRVRVGKEDEACYSSQDVSQTDGSGTKPVLSLTQHSPSRPFINFLGSNEADGESSVVTSSGTAGTKNFAIKVLINGTQEVWLRAYSASN